MKLFSFRPSVGVGAGKFLGVRKIFARIPHSPVATGVWGLSPPKLNYEAL